MSDAAVSLALLGLAAIALALASMAALRGWLDLRRAAIGSSPPPAPARSELSALRERIRRLEAIAEGRG